MYENSRERLHQQTQNRYRNLLEKAKDIQREYWKNRYKNLPVEDK